MIENILILTVVDQQLSAVQRGILNVWTVYDHPADYPQGYIARCFEMDQPTNVIIAGELDTIRECFMHCGLVCLHRAPTDDPVIMETWV